MRGGDGVSVNVSAVENSLRHRAQDSVRIHSLTRTLSLRNDEFSNSFAELRFELPPPPSADHTYRLSVSLPQMTFFQ